MLSRPVIGFPPAPKPPPTLRGEVGSGDGSVSPTPDMGMKTGQT